MMTTTRPDNRIDLTPRKASPRLPTSIDEIDVRNIPLYPHTDCPRLVSATIKGSKRYAIELVGDPVAKILCLIPLERLLDKGRVQRQWFGKPMNVDLMRVTPLPQSEVPPDVLSTAMSWFADLRDERVADMTAWLDDINERRVLGKRSCAGCDELSHQDSLSFSSRPQHAA